MIRRRMAKPEKSSIIRKKKNKKKVKDSLNTINEISKESDGSGDDEISLRKHHIPTQESRPESNKTNIN